MRSAHQSRMIFFGDLLTCRRLLPHTPQDEGSYIRLLNLQSKVLTHNIYGRVSKSILPFLIGIHVGPVLPLFPSTCACVGLSTFQRPNPGANTPALC